MTTSLPRRRRREQTPAEKIEEALNQARGPRPTITWTVPVASGGSRPLRYPPRIPGNGEWAALTPPVLREAREGLRGMGGSPAGMPVPDGGQSYPPAVRTPAVDGPSAGPRPTFTPAPQIPYCGDPYGATTPARDPEPAPPAAADWPPPPAGPSRLQRVLADRSELPHFRGALRLMGWHAMLPYRGTCPRYLDDAWRDALEAIVRSATATSKEARVDLRARASVWDAQEAETRKRRRAAADAAPALGWPAGIDL